MRPSLSFVVLLRIQFEQLLQLNSAESTVEDDHLIENPIQKVCSVSFIPFLTESPWSPFGRGDSFATRAKGTPKRNKELLIQDSALLKLAIEDVKKWHRTVIHKEDTT
jgi:hypothetical protein